MLRASCQLPCNASSASVTLGDTGSSRLASPCEAAEHCRRLKGHSPTLGQPGVLSLSFELTAHTNRR